MAKETDQYNMVCKDEFAEIKGLIRDLTTSIKGNGKEGLTVRLVKVEQVIKFLVGAAVLLAVPLAGLLVKTVIEHFGR